MAKKEGFVSKHPYLAAGVSGAAMGVGMLAAHKWAASGEKNPKKDNRVKKFLRKHNVAVGAAADGLPGAVTMAIAGHADKQHEDVNKAGLRRTRLKLLAMQGKSRTATEIKRSALFKGRPVSSVREASMRDASSAMRRKNLRDIVNRMKETVTSGGVGGFTPGPFMVKKSQLRKRTRGADGAQYGMKESILSRLIEKGVIE